jgi:hypothetical protein
MQVYILNRITGTFRVTPKVIITYAWEGLPNYPTSVHRQACWTWYEQILIETVEIPLKYLSNTHHPHFKSQHRLYNGFEA